MVGDKLQIGTTMMRAMAPVGNDLMPAGAAAVAATAAGADAGAGAGGGGGGEVAVEVEAAAAAASEFQANPRLGAQALALQQAGWGREQRQEHQRAKRPRPERPHHPQLMTSSASGSVHCVVLIALFGALFIPHQK